MSSLEFHNATIRFGGLTAVAPLSFEIPPGQLAAIIGPNGAGKTTVFNLITGVYAPTEGEIWFNGELIAAGKKPLTLYNYYLPFIRHKFLSRRAKSLRPNKLTRRGIARTFQNIRLFGDLTVEDNVRCACVGHAGYGLWSTLMRDGKQARQEAAIQDETDRLLSLFDLQTRKHIAARNLPYGDQRRLEIARALATRPKLLLLDEPTSGMNPSETREVTDLIRKVREQFNITVLLIEHHMSLVMGICERVIVLDGGVKIADDMPTAVQNNPHVIAAYLGEPDPELDAAIAHGEAVVSA